MVNKRTEISLQVRDIMQINTTSNDLHIIKNLTVAGKKIGTAS